MDIHTLAAEKLVNIASSNSRTTFCIKYFLVAPISKAACNLSDRGIAGSSEGIRETIFPTTVFSKLADFADSGQLSTKEPISTNALSVEVHKNVLLLSEIIIETNPNRILSYMDFDTAVKLSGNVAKICRPLTADIHDLNQKNKRESGYCIKN